MGGKQKQANRTKGNVRPSSSARAAEQLSASGVTSTGFIGFGALSGDLGYVPTTQGNEEADSSVDGDFRMILRKLSKRDATTKLKALQELVVLIKDKEEEDVKTMLPFWPRVYNKVSVDNDRRVRESLQETFEVLVRKVRRSLAPHLKLLMGSWMVAQNDVYAPAASSAKSAFQAAFPPVKQAEAINFCKDEIMAHIEDNLLNQTPTSLSDPKTTDPEDMENKYQKMISASLLAWRMLMSALRPDQLPDLNDRVLTVLTDNKLWKHAKSTNPMIQGAFYSLLAGLCQYNADMAQQVADKVCPTVLGRLEETEPTVCPHLWEAVLCTITAIPDCWSRVNVRKAVWPKLWMLLRNAGSGSASAIYPNMLPLLSKITPEVMGAPIKFYSEFFTNMKHGLTLEKTQVSHSEMSAVVVAFLECLRYCLVCHLMNDDESRKVQDFLVNEQLLPLIEASIVNKSPALSTSPLYAGLVELLTFLNKLANTLETEEDTEDKTKSKEAARIRENIWKSLSETLRVHIETVEDDNENILDRVAALLMAFRNPTKLERKKSRVRFSDAGEKLERSTQPLTLGKAKSSLLKKMPSVTTPSKDLPAGTLAFMEADSPLIKLVCCTCRIAHDKYHHNKSPMYLHYLSQMFCSFLSDHLLHELFTLTQGQGATLGENQSRLEFFQTVLAPWLKNLELGPGKGTESERDSLIEMSVTLVRDSPVPENLAMLEVMTQLDERLLGMVSRRVLVLTAEDGAVARWFRGPVFGERVVGVARALCEQSLQATETDKELTAARWDLLTFALSSMDSLESVLGEDYVDQMLTEMRHSLPATSEQKSLTPEQVTRCVSFVCDVATNFYSNIKGCLLVASAEALLASLFTLSCQHNPVITDAVHDKVYAAWQLGVRALLCQRGGLLSDNSFFAQVAAQLKAQVLTDGITFKRLKRLGNLAVSLCTTMAEETGVSDSGDGDSSEENLYNFRKMLHIPCDYTINTKWWSHQLVTDRLTFTSFPHELQPPKVKVIPKNVASVVFSSFILEASGLYDTPPTSPTSDVPPEGDNETRRTEEFDLVRDVVYTTGYCRCILGGRRQELANTELGQGLSQLESTLMTLLHPVPAKFEEDFTIPLLKRAVKEGQLWAVTLRTLFEVVPDLHWTSKLTDILQPNERLNSLTEASLQTLQVAAPYMSLGEVRPLVDMVAAQVITCPQETLMKVDGGLGLLSLLVHLLETMTEPFGGIEGQEESRPTDVMISVLDEVKLWHGQADGLFAFEESSSQETQFTFNMAAIQLMRQVVAVGPSVMSHAHWDFVLCSMVAWVQAFEEMRSRILTDVQVQAFGAVLSRLVTGVATCLRHVLPAQPDAFPADLPTEWTDFFGPGTFSLLLPIFIELTEKIDLSAPSSAEAELLTQVCAAVSLCPAEQLRNNKLTPRLVADQESALPDQLQTVLNTLCPLLGSPARPVQVAAYRLLHAVVDQLAAFDLDAPQEEDDQKEEVSRSPPVALVSVLETSGSLVKMLVIDLRPGDRVTTPPHTHEYTAAMAYLLSWKLMLAFFRAAPAELRAQYSLCLRDLGAVDALLTHLFHLMPENPVINLKDSLSSASPSQKLGSTSNMFSEPPRLEPTASAVSEEVQHAACSVYAQALQDVPAMVRTWWTSQDRRTAEIIDRFTTKFVSPIQIAAELTATKQQQLEKDNMNIVVRPAAREVAATYVLDEMSIELVVTMPVNHPLGVISVETGKRIGVANTQWRNWMLQMVTFLNHQNGSMVEALMLWKRNVDKRFEGLEDCLICYSVIHGSNYQLPRLGCKTCKKKFHSACLYKWFNTSNNSSCPLCRSLF